MENTDNKEKIKKKSNGWERKFTIEENRVQEYIELYESLGKEVKVESVKPEEIEGCSTCFEEKCNKYKTIYTRERQL